MKFLKVALIGWFAVQVVAAHAQDFVSVPGDEQGAPSAKNVREIGLELCSGLYPGQVITINIGSGIKIIGNSNLTCSVSRLGYSMQLCEQLYLKSDSLGCSNSLEGFSVLQLNPGLQAADLTTIAGQLYLAVQPQQHQVAPPAVVTAPPPPVAAPPAPPVPAAVTPLPPATKPPSTYERPYERPRSYGCFTGETLVATPNGEKPISQVKVGDIVLSYSHETGRLVENKVMALLTFDPKVSRALRVASASAPIFVTEEHPFYPLAQSTAPISQVASTSDAYREIGEISPGTDLLSVEWNGGGDYAVMRTLLQDYSRTEIRREQVMTLSMAAEPRNFVVIVPGSKRGIIVHNKIIHFPF